MPESFVPKLEYTPVVRPYIKGATEEYAAAQKQLREDYDTTASHYDALQEAADNIQHLEGDEEKKNSLMQKVNGVIGEAAKAGDYENRGRLVRKAIADFKKEYNPIAAQVSAYKEYEKETNDRVKAKDITSKEGEEQLQLARKFYKENQGFKKNPDGTITGGFTKYANQRASHVDELKQINEAIHNKLSNPNSEITEAVGLTEDGNWKVNTKHGIKIVTPKELRSIVGSAIEVDENWKNYIKDLGYFDSHLRQTPESLQTHKESVMKEVASKIITPDVLNTKIQELSKLKHKPENLQDAALEELKKDNYNTPEDAQKLLQGLSGADARALYANNFYNNQINKAGNYASLFAYKQTEDGRDMTETDQYKNFLRGKADIDVANAQTSQGKGETVTPSKTYNDFHQKLQTSQELTKTIAKQNIGYRDELAKIIGTNSGDIKNIQDKSIQIQNIFKNNPDVESQTKALEQIGIKNADLTNLQIVTNNYLTNVEDFKKEKTRQVVYERQKENIRKLLDMSNIENSTLKYEFDNINKSNIADVQKKGINEDLAQYGVDITNKNDFNKYKNLALDYENNPSKYKNLSEATKNYLQMSLSKYNNEIKKAEDRAIKNGNFTSNNITNTFLVNSKENSFVNTTNENEKLILNQNLFATTIAGTKKDLLSYLVNDAGYSLTDAKKAKLISNSIESVPTSNGEEYKRTNYITVEMPDGQKITTSVNTSDANKQSHRDALIYEFFKKPFGKSQSIDGLQHSVNQGNIAMGFAMEGLQKETDDLLTLENAEVNKDNSPKQFQSKATGIKYTVTDKGRYYSIDYLDASGKLAHLDTGETPQKVLETIGTAELNQLKTTIPSLNGN